MSVAEKAMVSSPMGIARNGYASLWKVENNVLNPLIKGLFRWQQLPG